MTTITLDAPTVARPAPIPLVYLRGAGRPDATWTRVETAMWARGWTTERDRTTAWHAARGGTPVVLCDFSTDQDNSKGAWFGYDLRVEVALVRAVYQDVKIHGKVLHLLTAEDTARAMRAGDDWVHRAVTVVTQEMEWRRAGPHRSRAAAPNRPNPQAGADGEPDSIFDERVLADMVAAELKRADARDART